MRLAVYVSEDAGWVSGPAPGTKKEIRRFILLLNTLVDFVPGIHRPLFFDLLFFLE